MDTTEPQMKQKTMKIKYEAIPTTEEQITDIFRFVFDKIAEYEALDNSNSLSNTYNRLGDQHERRN